MLRRTDTQTGKGTENAELTKEIPICRYASQAAQKRNWPIRKDGCLCQISPKLILETQRPYLRHILGESSATLQFPT